MSNKGTSLLARWMISPLEIISVVAVFILTIGGLSISIQDALQLERAINLNLTQTLIVNQGIVNLQREVILTHTEVLRLLGGLDSPPVPVTRFDFVEIQVNNLVKESESPSGKLIFVDEAVTLVAEIKDQTAGIEQNISDWKQSKTTEQQITALQTLDTELGVMESTVKKLIDHEAKTQREAIIQTRDSLGVSQRTSFIAGGILILLSVALIFVFRRALAARLRRAEEADQLKSQLLANVSHELRTPINAIHGYSQLLDEEAYGKLTGDQQSTIHRILINTTQLNGMVNNLLDSAQIEQGKLTLRNTPFTPAELMEATHAALNILASTKNLELLSEVAPDVPAELNGDALRLQQILFNLVSNAIKFTESGNVRMRIFLPDKEHWALQVSDTGIGIPLEAQAQVFAAFWQVDSSATRQYRGSGLGLSIVKQLASFMNGNITLTSQPGKGSTFTVAFPMETQ